MTDTTTEASARACANIALAKYWGKADVKRNVPAVPSISLTLDQLVTETRVRFDPSLGSDVVRLDGRRATAAEAERVITMLDRVRREAGLRLKAQVNSHNHFPTAAGLASSASGFAAPPLASWAKRDPIARSQLPDATRANSSGTSAGRCCPSASICTTKS